MDGIAPLANPDLAPYEAAARIYCAKTGMDPDAEMVQRHPHLRGVTVRVPFWHKVAEQMIDLSLMLTSIREASQASAVIVPGKREN